MQYALSDTVSYISKMLSYTRLILSCQVDTVQTRSTDSDVWDISLIMLITFQRPQQCSAHLFGSGS